MIRPTNGPLQPHQHHDATLEQTPTLLREAEVQQPGYRFRSCRASQSSAAQHERAHWFWQVIDRDDRVFNAVVISAGVLTVVLLATVMFFH
ncbi:hypothetical protein CQ14_06720 [Bradyrhizobium lablabi]|uniref:Uncharacterized protein n=1 Tax=Bradyrhizobium lablabi TaxID=722472 RepID=A0A0R3MME2_9BRAD|nr:hypothetical protein CQ14_06720 [Bradyrhizobium lablabi]